MKFIQLPVVLIFLSIYTLSYGQSVLDKGNYQLGGSVTYDRGKSNNAYFHDKYTDIQLSPEYSYFVMDNLLIGGLISFDYNKYEWTYPDHYLSRSKSLGIGPLVKYYFRTDNLIPFISASATYNKYLDEDEHGYNLNFSTGLDFFIAKSLALEPFISYSTSNYYKPDSDSKQFSFGLRLSYFIIK